MKWALLEFLNQGKPADITVSELKKSAFSESSAMFNSARSSGDDEIDLAVLEKTQEDLTLERISALGIPMFTFELPLQGHMKLVGRLASRTGTACSATFSPR